MRTSIIPMFLTGLKSLHLIWEGAPSVALIPGKVFVLWTTVCERTQKWRLESSRDGGSDGKHRSIPAYLLIRETFKEFAVNKLRNRYQILLHWNTDNFTKFCLRISPMLSVSTFGYTADIYTIIHFIAHACQHCTVDQSHSSGDTAAS
jgi:hypothetical protein